MKEKVGHGSISACQGNKDAPSHTRTTDAYRAVHYVDSEIVMVDLTFGDDLFEKHRSRDDFGTTISVI